MRIRPYNPSESQGRDVVNRFLRKEAKNIADARAGVYDALRFLEITPEVDCKRTGKIENLRGGVREFKWQLRDHWLRIFVAYYPTGSDVAILHLVLKKTNAIDEDDIKQATSNFTRYKQQCKGRR
jgi:phage-related protein